MDVSDMALDQSITDYCSETEYYDIFRYDRNPFRDGVVIYLLKLLTVLGLN